MHWKHPAHAPDGQEHLFLHSAGWPWHHDEHDGMGTGGAHIGGGTRGEVDIDGGSDGSRVCVMRRCARCCARTLTVYQVYQVPYTRYNV